MLTTDLRNTVCGNANVVSHLLILFVCHSAMLKLTKINLDVMWNCRWNYIWNLRDFFEGLLVLMEKRAVHICCKICFHIINYTLKLFVFFYVSIYLFFCLLYRTILYLGSSSKSSDYGFQSPGIIQENMTRLGNFNGEILYFPGKNRWSQAFKIILIIIILPPFFAPSTFF